MRRVTLKLLLGLALAWVFAAAAQSAAVVIQPGADRIRVGAEVELLREDKDQPLALDQVTSAALQPRWTAHKGRNLTLGRVIHPVWVRFDLRNESDRADWLVWVDWPSIHGVEFHAYDKTAGRWLEPPSRPRAPIKDPSYRFELDPPKGHVIQVLMRVQPVATAIIPIEIRTLEDFPAQRHDHAIVMGLVFGILVAMLLYNTSLAVFTRDRSYVYYSLFVATVVLYELAVTGYGRMYLWGGWNWLAMKGYGIFASLSFFFATLFFRHFMRLHERSRHLVWINNFLLCYWTVTTPISLLHPTPLLYAGMVVIGGLSGIAALYSSVYLALRGSVAARYFLIAWATVLVGTSYLLLWISGHVERSLMTDYGQHLGFVVEAVLLSIALADRIRSDRERREKAQQEALDLQGRLQTERELKIRAQEHALGLQRQANQALEMRVLERTGELQRTMKNLELANTELARISITDALTKVHNRRHFDEVLQREHARAVRTRSNLSLLLADIDHFKRINDGHGHLIGDECLQLVAAALRATVVRSGDLIARYGGEEFAIVLPGASAADATAVAERVRRAVEEIHFVHRGQRIALSVSIGVAAVVEDQAMPLNDLVRQADKSLYRAKDAGRNVVVLNDAVVLAS